jgi:hypothetical protein
MKRETAAAGAFLAICLLCAFFGFMYIGVKSYNEQEQRIRLEVANEQKENEESANKGILRIGMTADQCRTAWGYPEHVNRTRRAEGVHEQWVYDGDHYLYLDNGVLRSIQGVGRPESAPAEVTPSEGTPSVTHVAVATATPAPVATPLRNPDTVTITKPISIAVRYGSAGVAAGTKLPFVSRAGDKVRVRYYDGADYDIPISATDLK